MTLIEAICFLIIGVVAVMSYFTMIEAIERDLEGEDESQGFEV